MGDVGFSSSVFLVDDTATSMLGRRIANVLERGDVVLLDGPIGAGKTHLARAIIQTLLSKPEEVPSPTYTIVQTYASDETEIVHADLYRLGDFSELAELGLTDALDTALVLIEWPERMGELAPKDALTILLSIEGNGRRVALTATDPKWTKLHQVLCND